MKTDIVLAGVGGQGILSIAAVIGLAAAKEDLFIKQSEIHGMSQQGGEVYAHLRLSDKPVFSDMIPLGQGDLILSVEPLESLRYLPFLKKEGWLVTNSSVYNNISDYPEKDALVREIEKVPHLASPQGEGQEEELIITERHRHRFEVNPKFHDILEKN